MATLNLSSLTNTTADPSVLFNQYVNALSSIAFTAPPTRITALPTTPVANQIYLLGSGIPTPLTAGDVLVYINPASPTGYVTFTPANGAIVGAFIRQGSGSLIDWVASGAGAGITDGDKGDITVTSTGATWTIDPNTVTLSKLQTLPPATLIGRATAGVGNAESITIGSGLALTGTTLSVTGGGTSAVVASWQLKTANYTAVPGDKLRLDATASDIVITLPPTPSATGADILFQRLELGANKVLLRTGVNKINAGANQDAVFAPATTNLIEGVSYVNSTIGWLNQHNRLTFQAYSTPPTSSASVALTGVPSAYNTSLWVSGNSTSSNTANQITTLTNFNSNGVVKPVTAPTNLNTALLKVFDATVNANVMSQNSTNNGYLIVANKATPISWLAMVIINDYPDNPPGQCIFGSVNSFPWHPSGGTPMYINLGQTNLGQSSGQDNGQVYIDGSSTGIGGLAVVKPATWTIQYWDMADSLSPAFDYIGGRDRDDLYSTSYWRGKFAEIIVGTALLPVADRNRIEGYLAHKYQLTAKLPAGHPYKNSAPTPTPAPAPSTDPLFSMVKLLLNLNGDILDRSPTPKTFGLVNTLVNFSGSNPFGVGQSFFTSNASHIIGTSVSDFVIPANTDFCFEGFVQFTDPFGGSTGFRSPSKQHFFGLDSEAITLGYATSNSIGFFVNVNQASAFTLAAPTPTLNTWHFWQVQRTSGVIKGYFNEVEFGTATNNSAIGTSGQLRIASTDIAGDSVFAVHGNSSNVRLTVGAIRSTARPTAPFPTS